MKRTATKRCQQKVERFQVFLGPFNPAYPPHGSYADRDGLIGFLTRWAEQCIPDDHAEMLTVLTLPKAAKRKGGAL